MTRPLIAGNWKMNTTIHQGAELVIRLRELLKGADAAEVLIAPPFTSLYHISHLVAGSAIKLCAQNMSWEKKGAFTGEVSAEMLRDSGCSYVILGHSERREIFGETDDMVNRKVMAALRDGIKPIICVGETLKEREQGKTLKKVKAQVEKALAGVVGSAMKEVTVAYEPIWAIGTGKTATPNEAEEVHNTIRELLYEMYEPDILKEVRLIYGGSVKADNIDSLMAQPSIDGALVGGASLKAEEFARIVNFRPL